MDIDEETKNKIIEHRKRLISERQFDTVFDITSSFNHCIFFIVGLCKTKKPLDSNIYRLKNIMSAAKSVDHEVLIKSAGPYLIESYSSIIDRTHNPFTTEWISKKVGNMKNQKNQEFVIDVFTAARDLIDNGLTQAEKNTIFDKLNRMLDDFLLYSYAVVKSN